MLSFIVLFKAMSSRMTIVWDRRLGFLTKLFTTPVPRATIIISKTISSVIRALTQATIILLIAIQTKPHTIRHIRNIHRTIPNCLRTRIIIHNASNTINKLGITNGNNEPTQPTTTLRQQTFYPTNSMPTWLQPIAEINPLTYTNDTIRQLLIGAPGTHSLIFSYIYLATFASIFATIGIILSWKYLSK